MEKQFGYYYLSRQLIIDSLENRHLEARKNLNESQAFAVWAADERERRTPKLTPEQKEQLQNYLQLVAEQSPEIYPSRRP